jgi:hypothetical protein
MAVFKIFQQFAVLIVVHPARPNHLRTVDIGLVVHPFLIG